MTLPSLLGLLVLLSLSIPSPTRADATLVVAGCTDIDVGELRQLLAIELRTLGAAPAAAGNVRVRCEGDLVEVLTQSRPGEPSLRTQLTLHGAERGAITRLLALRISELVAPPSAPAVAPPPDPPRPAEAQPAVLPVRSLQTAFTAMATLRRMGDPGTWLSGLAVGGARSPFAHLTIHGALGLALGRTSTKIADLSWRELSLAISVLGTARLGTIELGAGPGFRGAWAWLAAKDVSEGKRGRSLSAPWAGPFVVGRIALPARSRWQVALDLEAGLVMLPVQGLIDGKDALLTIDGSWLGAQLGASHQW